MTFNAFDVVAVPFPFTDREASKRRPALVISNDRFNLNHDHMVLAMITTATKKTVWPSDVVINHWQEAGLKVPCRVRLKLFTLDNHLILKTVGHLLPQDVQSVQAVLTEYLDVASTI